MAADAPTYERQNSREAWRSARAADYSRNRRIDRQTRNRQKEKQCHADGNVAPDRRKKISAGPQRLARKLDESTLPRRNKPTRAYTYRPTNSGTTCGMIVVSHGARLRITRMK